MHVMLTHPPSYPIQYDCTIQALKENDKNLERTRQLNESQKAQQREEIEHLNVQNLQLTLRKEALEKELEHYRNEEGKANDELTKTKSDNEGTSQSQIHR